MGYFPSVPIRPTLAVDINLLEFVSIGSHYMAPNVAGWSNAIQYFLSIRGYTFGEQVRAFITRVSDGTEDSIGNNPAAFRGFAALVPGSSCNGRPGSRLMGPEYGLRRNAIP